ncbi:hypothetical protein BDV93DRAFT_508930 [Ceratobasidium sp. AG-I]|nr:hypothetical protein BDV93DRAFT_508930 [Ceratobasidium sp. AG-I]
MPFYLIRSSVAGEAGRGDVTSRACEVYPTRMYYGSGNCCLRVHTACIQSSEIRYVEILFPPLVQVVLLDENVRSYETEDACAGETSIAIRHTAAYLPVLGKLNATHLNWDSSSCDIASEFPLKRIPIMNWHILGGKQEKNNEIKAQQKGWEFRANRNSRSVSMRTGGSTEGS